jgi:hypothetical protein
LTIGTGFAPARHLEGVLLDRPARLAQALANQCARALGAR